MLGVSPAITAGAVISGAYLGDKTVAAVGDDDPDRADGQGRRLRAHQAAGLDVGAGVRHRGRRVPRARRDRAADTVTGAETTSELDEARPDLLHHPARTCCRCVLLAFLSIRKVPASLALLAVGALRGDARRVPPARRVRRLRRRAAATSVVESIKAVWQAMANGFSIDSGIPDIDRLLLARRHGQHAADDLADHRRGDLRRDARGVRPDQPAGRPDDRSGDEHRTAVPDRVRAAASDSTSSPATSTSRWCCRAGCSGPSSRKRGLAPTNLSRLAADSGTVTSPLVPWNSCGAFMGAMLGVSTLLVPAVRLLQLRQPGAERPLRLHRLQDREDRTHRLQEENGMTHPSTEQPPAAPSRR